MFDSSAYVSGFRKRTRLPSLSTKISPCVPVGLFGSGGSERATTVHVIAAQARTVTATIR